MIVQNNRKMTRKKNQGTFRKNFTIFFDFFFSKSRNCKEFTKFMPKTESRNREDHEL